MSGESISADILQRVLDPQKTWIRLEELPRMVVPSPRVYWRVQCTYCGMRLGCRVDGEGIVQVLTAHFCNHHNWSREETEGMHFRANPQTGPAERYVFFNENLRCAKAVKVTRIFP